MEFLFPVFIFLAEVLHVTFATIRVLFVARGLKLPAAIVGFFEVLVFLLALGQITSNLTNWVNYIAFAGGFASGSVVGLWIEEKMAVGLLSVQIITNNDAQELTEYLRKENFGVTSVTATGMSGKVRMLVILIKRKHLVRLQSIVERFHPNAFMSVQDVRMIKNLRGPATVPIGTSPVLMLKKWLKR